MTDQSNAEKGAASSTTAKGSDQSPGLVAPPVADRKHYHVRPNTLRYTQDGGKTYREIWIHRDRYDECMKHFVNEDWDALAKFPLYTNAPDQQYTEEDYFTPADEEEKST